MNKKQILLIIIFSLIFGAIGSWLFTRYIIPKLNTIQFFVKYNLAPKPGPLVINTREEIRVNEGADAIAAIQKAQTWTVAVLSGKQIISGGLVLTSDGLIASTKAVLNQPQLQIKFFDGSIAKAIVKSEDPASDLVFLSAQPSQNLATAVFGAPKDLALGQRLAVLYPSFGDSQENAFIAYLSSQFTNFDYQKIFSSEEQSQTFSIDRASSQDGAVVISLDGNVQGIFSKGSIISAETIKSAMNSYFNNSGKIIRNFVGLNYQYIPKALSLLNNQVEGVILKKNSNAAAVLPGSPAEQAGLQEGDIIVAVAGIQIDSDNSFEELLSKYNSGQVINLSVFRGGTIKELLLTLKSK
jgi:S1-C subfamily serine protease